MSIKSFVQLSTLMKSSPDIKFRLKQTFTKIEKGIFLFKYLVKMTTKYKLKNDRILYQRLHKLYNRLISEDKNFVKETDEYLIKRGLNRAQNIDNILKKIPNHIEINSYLDIGTGNGIIAESIGKLFNIESKKVNCIDVESGVIKKIGKCNFQIYDGKNLPFKKESIDLITMFMVMHHVEKPEELLKSIYNVLKPKGLLILREHDADSEDLKILIDVQHALYSILHVNQDYDTFRRTYYGNYYSEKELDKMLKKYNFKKLKIDHDIKFRKNPLNYYYSVWIKN